MRSSGQSLFEVVVAIAIVTLILTAIVSLAATSVRNTSFSRNRSLATTLSQDAVEWLRGERDASWPDFSTEAQIGLGFARCLVDLEDGLGGSPCGSGDRIDNLFTREVAFTIIDAVTIQVDVAVGWSDSQGFHKVSTSTYFTDWRAQ